MFVLLACVVGLAVFWFRDCVCFGRCCFVLFCCVCLVFLSVVLLPCVWFGCVCVGCSCFVVWLCLFCCVVA